MLVMLRQRKKRQFYWVFPGRCWQARTTRRRSSVRMAVWPPRLSGAIGSADAVSPSARRRLRNADLMSACAASRARRMAFIRSPGWRPRGPQHPWPRAICASFFTVRSDPACKQRHDPLGEFREGLRDRCRSPRSNDSADRCVLGTILAIAACPESRSPSLSYTSTRCRPPLF